VRMTNARQRRAAFPDGAPLSAYCAVVDHSSLTVGAGYGATLARESLRTACGRKSERVRRRPALAQAPRARATRPARAALCHHRSPSEPSTSSKHPCRIAGKRSLVCTRRVFRRIYAVGASSRAARGFERHYWVARPWVDRGGRKPRSDPRPGASRTNRSYLIGRRTSESPRSRG
jgi:hypothetical protein